MHVTLRPGRPEDASPCGEICYEAFKVIAEKHGFPPDFPSPESACGALGVFLARPDIYSVVAEVDGRIVGSNFLWESPSVAGIGPITVEPGQQNSSAGRALMQAVLQRAEERAFASVRLVQAAYHNRSLSLYTKLGFAVTEPLSILQGPAIDCVIDGHAVRLATAADIRACNELCETVHGHSRAGDLAGAVEQGVARVVEHDGRISGYATAVGFFGHGVAETNEDLKALIGAAPEFPGPGFLLPTRNSAVLRWCLERGLRVVQPMSLMSRGLYREPAGAFFPSILF